MTFMGTTANLASPRHRQSRSPSSSLCLFPLSLDCLERFPKTISVACPGSHLQYPQGQAQGLQRHQTPQMLKPFRINEAENLCSLLSRLFLIVLSQCNYHARDTISPGEKCQRNIRTGSAWALLRGLPVCRCLITDM